jgi:nucleoside-diphosphate-sugar epimerase
LITGGNGFIAGYAIPELLERGHEVISIDNYSKYGRVAKSFHSHPRFHEVAGDCKDVGLMKELCSDVDQVLAGAAMIGGISYFHALAYDLLAENERIIAATFDAAIWAYGKRKLQKINVLSSSMVFESSTVFPTPETAVRQSYPPLSTYGFQKLATEYFAQGAREQYGLPYTIIRPFNCVGVGEQRALTDVEVMSGNVKLAMSHAVPDLIQKVMKGQDPLRILGDGSQVRHYTYGGDLARGIRLCIEQPEALNEDFNLSTTTSTSVLELAETIWKRLNPTKSFRYVSDPAYTYDVQRRIPDCAKAKRVLGFDAPTTLDQMLDELVPWIRKQVELGTI